MKPMSSLIWLLISAAPAVAGLCDDPRPWPDPARGAVLFHAVDVIDPALRAEPDAGEPVELNADVLGTGAQDLEGLALNGLALRGPAICVRYYPEWLGLDLVNTGSLPVTGRLVLTAPTGTIDAILPPVPPGGARRVLLRASIAIAGMDASEFRLVLAD